MGAGLVLARLGKLHAASRPPAESEVKLPAGGVMPRRKLGRTGLEVSLLGLGGWHIGAPADDALGVRIVHAAIDHGVDFLDNCWDYNGGRSEERMGRALKDGRRHKVVLMTKLDGRTRASATAQLEQSLKRLGTDMIDLVQIHEVIRESDAERVFGPGGAIEALLDAKKAGKLRFIGFTGHKSPGIHLHMLKRAEAQGFTFDAVQMPLNVLDPHYQSFEREVLPRLVERDIAVLGMKPFASGAIADLGVATPSECLRYPMSLPSSVVITGCDSMGVLMQGLSAALSFKPLAAGERQALLARTRALGERGQHEAFKTSTRFDGTTQHPQWLETATL
jgi:aryl-alcohol dehydrogenase-like predicted oxidoreductase